jgi:nucleolar MIF4G domain-containing protein 1
METLVRVFSQYTWHHLILIGSQGRTSGRNRDHGPPHQFSRKAARKQERQQRKSRKAEYHTKNVSLTRPSSSLFGKRPAIQEHEHSPQHKKLKTTHSTLATASAYKFRENDKNSKPKKFSAPTSGPSSTLKAKVRKTTALELLAGKPSPKALKFSQSRTQKEKDEDSYIQYLEGKLGWTKNGQKTRKYGSGLEDEGWGGKSRKISNARIAILN